VQCCFEGLLCCCDPGNCHLQPRIGSVDPDKLAYGVLYVPV